MEKLTLMREDKENLGILSLGMAWEQDKDKLWCQANNIYTADPSLISKRKTKK